MYYTSVISKLAGVGALVVVDHWGHWGGAGERGEHMIIRGRLLLLVVMLSARSLDKI